MTECNPGFPIRKRFLLEKWAAAGSNGVRLWQTHYYGLSYYEVCEYANSLSSKIPEASNQYIRVVDEYGKILQVYGGINLDPT